MASTETGIPLGEIPPPEIWNYYRYNERLGHTMRHYADGMYELVVKKGKEKEVFQGIFFTFLEIDTYEMRDLYIEHPAYKGWWRSSGRIRDVVIMADARKLNTIPYEAVVEQHPCIATTLICGSGRPRPAVLVQPSKWPDTKEEERNLIEDARPTFGKANAAEPVFGRLVKELVVMAKKSKPMVKAGGKDTVMRKRGLGQHEE